MITIRAVTYNVMLGKHLDRIIDWVNRLPDHEVMCFQEFPQKRLREFTMLLGRRPYGFRFTPSFTFRKNIFGQLTMFRKDLLELVSTRVVPLGINRVERSILRTSLPRTCLIMTFRKKDVEFVIVNVHVVALTVNKTKYVQVEHIVESICGRSLPTIMLGDFNISSVVGKRKLIAQMATRGFFTINSRLVTHRVSIFRHQFDYVFGLLCSVRRLKAERIRYSDHYPLLATIALP